MSCIQSIPVYLDGQRCGTLTPQLNYTLIKKRKIVEELKVTLEGTGDNKTLNILEGKYEHPPKRKPLIIAGVLGCVVAFFQSKAESIQKEKVVVVVNIEEGIITGFTDYDNELTDKIQGSLEYAADIKEMQINKGKTYGLKELISLIKFKRIHFADQEEYKKLLASLMSFSAKIEMEIKKENDNRGNIDDSFVMRAKSNIKLDFVMDTPIFKGGEKKKFKVDIMFDVRDRATSFYLESYEFNDIEQEDRISLLQEQMEMLSDYTIISQ